MKKKFKASSLLLALIMGISVLSGCAKAKEPVAEKPVDSATPTENTGETATGETEGKNDTLIYDNAAITKTIDPTLNNSTDGHIILCNVFEGLYNEGKDGVPVPGVAESVDISEDGLTYTFHLRDNAKWTDDKPVVAADFEYSWKRALNPETAAEYAYLMYYIKNGEAYNSGEGKVEDVGVKAIDERTLEVTLENPTSYFLGLTTFPTFYPIREDIVSANPDKWSLSPETYITNGKYKAVEINDKVNILLTKSESYWDAASTKLKNINILQIEDDNTGFANFKAGQSDMKRNVPQAEIIPGLADGLVKVYPMTGSYFITLNIDEPKASAIDPASAKALQDVRVREALSLAIDRTQITDFVKKDGSVPAHGFVPPAISNADGTSFASKEYFKPTGDPVKAKALLAEAGFPDGAGFPSMVYTYNSGAGHEAIAQALQGMWKEVLNIDIQLKNSEWAAFQTSRDNHDYIIARHGWIGDYNDATTFLEMFLSKSGQNNPGYNSADYDKFLKEAQKETDPAKRDVLLHKAEDTIMADLPIIPLYYYVQPIAAQPYVEGVIFSNTSAIYFDQVVLNK